jgi:PST family polysaccharide transporter
MGNDMATITHEAGVTQAGEPTQTGGTGSDPDRHFRTEHLHANLGERSVRATAITGLSQAVVLVLQVAGGIGLARLLSPNDYGLVGMATVVLGFLALFNDMGLSAATMQKPEVTHREASTTFWINLGISSFLAVLALLLAPAVAWFYSERRVAAILAPLAGSLIVTGLSFPQAAVLKRQMRFGTVAVIQVIATSCGLVAGISWAWVRGDFWALVVMQIISSLVLCSGFWLVSGWRPGRPGPLSIVRTQIRFGTHLTGSQVLAYTTRNLDNVLVGWYWGVEQLGLYARAYQLMLLPLRQVSAPIAQVAMPTLSRLQTNPERYARFYFTAVSVIAFVAMPFTVSMAILSDELILLLLGPKWIAASSIFRVLALAGLIEPFLSSADWIMGSTGRTDRLLRLAMIQTPLTALSFAIGLPWGAVGVATSYVCCSCMLAIPYLFFALKYAPVSASDVLRALWRPACISGAMALAMGCTRASIAGWPSLWVLLAAGGVGLAVFALMLASWRQARVQAGAIMKIAAILLGRRQASSLAAR